MKDGRFISCLTELIRLTATDLPGDVEDALRSALEREVKGSAPARVLETILENVELARRESLPICQDTGVPNFFVTLPEGLSPRAVREEIRKAVQEATALAFLRPNAVDALREENTGTNLGGDDFPVIEFTHHEGRHLVVDLLLKGGGCENVSAQYALPDLSLGAERNLDGIRRCVLHAVFKAQGLGCPPGAIGVAVGGDRATGYKEAKKTLLRKIGEGEDSSVAAWREGILRDVNRLGIGPMGLGGSTSLLDLKFSFLHRHPASFFVSVSYMCWAWRRRRLIWDGNDGRFI